MEIMEKQINSQYFTIAYASAPKYTAAIYIVTHTAASRRSCLKYFSELWLQSVCLCRAQLDFDGHMLICIH